MEPGTEQVLDECGITNGCSLGPYSSLKREVVWPTFYGLRTLRFGEGKWLARGPTAAESEQGPARRVDFRAVYVSDTKPPPQGFTMNRYAS